MVAAERHRATGGAPATTLHVIVNPMAGNGRSGRRWPGFARRLRDAGYDFKAYLTAGPGEATDIARRLARRDVPTLVCVGGDGTMNEVVNGLIDADRPISDVTRMLLIPCGTGRDLGRSLGVRGANDAIQALRDDCVATIDIGRIQYLDTQTGQLVTRYFANVADAGLGGATALRISRTSKRLGGLVSYMSSAVRSIATFQPTDVAVAADGQDFFDGSANMVVFANGAHFAGGMHVAPMASLCDGRLDVFVLEDVGRRALITDIMPRVYRGGHIGRRGVRHGAAATASVRASGSMLLEMDGEQIGQTPVQVEAVPRVLRVLGLPDALRQVGGCTDPRQ
ncbi:MAG TPA: diacylglycerol kinase family lipid kinase [Thermomicrobiales bacterium]|nr:diacylglycerol kinase family lipid kinase [Thermomicrobiales bacterium]